MLLWNGSGTGRLPEVDAIAANIGQLKGRLAAEGA